MSDDDTTTTTTTNTTTTDAPALKRVPPRQYRERPIFWHIPWTNTLLQSQPAHANGLIDLFFQPTGLRGVLIAVSQWCHAHDTREAIVYLTGGHDAAHTQAPDYYREPLEDSWRITSWRTGPMAVTYESLNIRVHVRVAAAWFDALADVNAVRSLLPDYAAGRESGVAALADAYSDLQTALRKQFGSGAYLLGTPAQTGLDLLEQSLPYHLQLPVLPAELREMIQHNSPQGRNEVLTAEDGPNATITELEWLQCYDAKLMYWACDAHVPAGPWEHLRGLEAELVFNENPYLVGFYWVAARVPDDWHHIGLLPMWDKDEKRTVYPWKPGTLIESFCTGAELFLAQENGWKFAIAEAIIWPDAMKLKPLETWRQKLLNVRLAAEGEGNALIASAVRHIHHDALGALARHDTREHHITPHDQAALIPGTAYNVNPDAPWGIEWDSDHSLSGWAARFQHPEIAAMVWGRGRARLAREGLRWPLEALVAGRTDAWWINRVLRDMQLWASKPGEWRLKEYLAGPHIPAPKDTAQLLKLMRLARGKDVVDDGEE